VSGHAKMPPASHQVSATSLKLLIQQPNKIWIFATLRSSMYTRVHNRLAGALSGSFVQILACWVLSKCNRLLCRCSAACAAPPPAPLDLGHRLAFRGRRRRHVLGVCGGDLSSCAAAAAATSAAVHAAAASAVDAAAADAAAAVAFAAAIAAVTAAAVTARAAVGSLHRNVDGAPRASAAVARRLGAAFEGAALPAAVRAAPAARPHGAFAAPSRAAALAAWGVRRAPAQQAHADTARAYSTGSAHEKEWTSRRRKKKS